MAENSRAPWLPPLFWIVGCASLMLFLIPAEQEWEHPTGEFSGLAVIVEVVLSVPLFVVILVVALIRKPVAYWVGIVLLSLPLLTYGMNYAFDTVAIMMAPDAADLEAGRGYFKAPGDRALAEAIVAGDAAKVGALAPAANLNAVGWNKMSFMELALEVDPPNREVLTALLKAGINPDQSSGNLWGLIYRDKDEALLRATLDTGVDLNKHVDSGDHWYLFLRYDWPEELELMLAHGANIEVRDGEGYTPLMRAAQAEAWPTVKQLLAHGARTDAVGNDGKTLHDLMPNGIPAEGEPAQHE